MKTINILIINKMLVKHDPKKIVFHSTQKAVSFEIVLNLLLLSSKAESLTRSNLRNCFEYISLLKHSKLNF